MLSDNGHLVFNTGDNKEIRFQTAANGRVKVGEEDLTQLMNQVSFLQYMNIQHTCDGIARVSHDKPQFKDM